MGRAPRSDLRRDGVDVVALVLALAILLIVVSIGTVSLVGEVTGHPITFEPGTTQALTDVVSSVVAVLGAYIGYRVGERRAEARGPRTGPDDSEA